MTHSSTHTVKINAFSRKYCLNQSQTCVYIHSSAQQLRYVLVIRQELMACKKVLYLWVILFIFGLALLASAAASRHQIRNARLLVTGIIIFNLLVLINLII